MNRLTTVLCFTFAFCSSVSADQLRTDTDYDYTIYLPDNWIREVSASGHHFYDTTFAHRGQVSIVRSQRDPLVYASPEEWTRAHFIAQTLTVESYATFPFYGVILYSDSTPTAKIGDLWAPEMYTKYFSADATYDDFSEYLIYTATNDVGYELYALADTADMNANVALYAAMLKCVTLPQNTFVGRTPELRSVHNTARAASAPRFTCNPAGSYLAWQNTPHSGLAVVPGRAIQHIRD